MENIKLGKYKHFKGNIYEVIGIAKHSETLEKFVVYRKESEIWVRPYEMFLEQINREGKIMPRFEYIGK